MSYDEGFIETVHDFDNFFYPVLKCSYDKLHRHWSLNNLNMSFTLHYFVFGL